MNSSYQYSLMIQEGRRQCVHQERNRNIKCSGGTAVCNDHPPIMALTGYYRRNVLDNLQMKATYTIDSYSYKK
jgi:hypothetical protein